MATRQKPAQKSTESTADIEKQLEQINAETPKTVDDAKKVAKSGKWQKDYDVPLVCIEMVNGASYCPVERDVRGNQVKYRRAFRRNPMNGRTEITEEVHPTGKMNRMRPHKPLNEGEKYVLHADEAAGLVFRGHAVLIEDHDQNMLTAEELDSFVPEAVRNFVPVRSTVFSGQ